MNKRGKRVDKNLKRDSALAEEVERWTKEKVGGKLQMRNVFGSVESATLIGKLLDQGAFTVDSYSVEKSAILSSGTTIHMFNEITRFINSRIRTADPGDFVWA